MKHNLVIFALFIVSLPVFGQQAATADALFKQGDWTAACAAYKKLHRQDPKNQVYTYRYARCLGELNRPEEAISLFETVNNIPLKDYFIAKEYYKVYRFADAAAALDTYLATIQPDNERYQKAFTLKSEAERAARWLAKTEDVLIYSVTKVPLAHWRDSLRLSAEAGTVTPDGVHINSLGDRRIYADSLGSIYLQTKLMDEWSESEKLPFGGINPFLAEDGITIYYSDKNPDGIGRYDICMSRLNTATQTYLLPSIIGMPFSSTGDDIFFAIDDEANMGVFVSVLNDSTAQIFRFIPGDEKKYMRGQDEAAIRQMAQRKTVRQPKTELKNGKKDEEFASFSPLFTKEDSVPATEIRFVLNDSTVYTNFADFRSDKARMLCRKLFAAQKELDHKTRELDKQRKKYNNSESSEERQCLVPLIMNLEKEMTALRQEIAALPQKIRSAELSKH